MCINLISYVLLSIVYTLNPQHHYTQNTTILTTPLYGTVSCLLTSQSTVAVVGSSVGMAFTAADMYHTMAPAAMTKFSRGLVSFISLWKEWVRGTGGE